MKFGFSHQIVPLHLRPIRKHEVKTVKQPRLWTRPGAVAALSIFALAGFVLCAMVGITIFSGTAFATPSSGFSSSVLGPTLFGEINVKTNVGDHKVVIKTQGSSDVYVVTNTVVPGGQSGWHTHPGPSLVTVKSGTATYYEGDDPTCTPRVVPAGEGFIDAGGDHVHMVRNEGSVQLEVVAVQIIPVGAARRIDAPDPGNCQF